MRDRLLELCLTFGENLFVSELLKLKPEGLDVEALLDGAPIPQHVETRIKHLHARLASGRLRPNPEFNRIVGSMLRYGGYNKQDIARDLPCSASHLTRLCSGERKVAPEQVAKCRRLLTARMKLQVLRECEMRSAKFEVISTSHRVGAPVEELGAKLLTIALAKLLDAWFDSKSDTSLPPEVPAVILKLSREVHVIVTTGDRHAAHEYYTLASFFLEQFRALRRGEHSETTEQWHKREISKLGPSTHADEPSDNHRK